MITQLKNTEISMINGGSSGTNNATMTIVESTIACSDEKECDTTKLMEAFCGGQSSCNVFPSLSLCCGYDPCQGFTKWLITDYKCSSGASKSSAIQFGYSGNLNCP